MSRMVLGNLLLRNPSSISTTNMMPTYSSFQPLDGTVIPIRRNDRPEITLVWDRVCGSDLDQLMNIVNSTQLYGSRDTVMMYYNDNHLLEGYVILVGASVSPIPSTGAYYTELGHAAHIMIQQEAMVSITVVPYEFTVLRGV